MKKFNLEHLLLGEPAITRDGNKVDIVSYNPKANEHSKLVGWVNDSLITWNNDGKHNGAEVIDSLDLFMEGEEEYYINIFRDDNGLWASEHAYEDLNDAKNIGSHIPHYFKTVKIFI